MKIFFCTLLIVRLLLFPINLFSSAHTVAGVPQDSTFVPLPERDEDARKIIATVLYGRLKEVKAVLKTVDLAHICTKEGFLPMFSAIETGRLKAVKLLLKKKASLSLRDHLFHTPLEKAVRLRNPAMVELLLKRNASINDPVYQWDDEKNKFIPTTDTLCMLAAAHPYNNVQVIEQLVAARASLNDRNQDGDTPLLIAARHAIHLDNVKKLIELGANTDTKTCKGESMVDLLKDCPSPDLAKFLEAQRALEEIKDIARKLKGLNVDLP